MTRREAIPAAVAVAAVIVAAVAHTLMAPAPGPALVSVCVLLAVAACAYVTTANLMHNREVDREEKRAAADDPENPSP